MKVLYIATCQLRESSTRFLDKSPIVEIKGKCIYKNGDYSIYKHCLRAYYYLWKNVIITELCGIHKDLIDHLASEEEYSEKDYRSRFIYDGAISDKRKAEYYAKIYKFKIT